MSDVKQLDCSGLVCPMPVAKTKKALSKMNSGDILRINGDFKEAGENIKRYVEQHDGKVLEFSTEEENYFLKIEKL
jgi:tRNA 2-thiouridine synthesizing protein A